MNTTLRNNLVSILIFVGLIGILIGVLHFQGHIFICDCGYVKLWHGVANDSQNSQHLIDWYTFSHIVHGFIFYWFFRRISRKKWSIGTCFLLAIGVEVGWEILENSPLIINRYRETAATLYFGDSIVNSVSDVIAVVVGFFLAWKLPVKLSIVFVLALELFSLYMIRDNLTLNVLMLAHPFEFIKTWQIQ